MRIVAGDDTKHECTDKEALDLNPTTAEDLDEEDGQEVPRHVTRRSDDQISVRILQEGIVFGFAFGEANRSEKDRLIEIDTVKGDIDEKPGGCGPEQLFQMPPLAEIDHEGLQLHGLGWFRNVCFDDGCVSIWG